MTLEDPSLSLSSLEARDSVSEAYHRAAKLFLNKQFPASLDCLRSVLSTPVVGEERVWTKIWNLYIALLNNAMARGGVWPKQEKKQLSQKVTGNNLWNEVESAFGGVEKIPEDVMVSLILISHKHCPDLSVCSDRIENYLSSGCGTGKVIEMYVMRILTKRGEFDYAREVISCNPGVFSNQDESLRKLKELEEEEKRKELEAEKERKRIEELEAKRVEDAMKAESSKQQQQIQESDESEGSDGTNLKAVSPNPVGSPSSYQPPTKTSSNEIRPRNLSSLFQYWKNYFINVFRNGSAIKAILFFMVIILSVTNPVARTRLRRALTFLWQKLAQTVQMGTKVSYV
ncbi:hypothetical protein TRICI_005908 [Trichomonascus ciferrii]|uniref:Peroxin 26 n=1 Tax=Trichomonascus ciferrii TaxID=44093 RepID=A0A642UUU6_9ASCO|nr:hypothetical protein TRICI_005908 [Trichomonascus ciferrii]